MSIAEKLTTIAENQPRIYQAGYDKGVAEGRGMVGDDYVVAINPPSTIKTYTDNVFVNIPANQFGGFKELTTVSAPYVKEIGSHAFDGCSKLTSLQTAPISGVGDYAFKSCGNLTSILFDSNGVGIGNYAFDSCGFQNVKFYIDGWTGKTIGESAFSNCTNLEKVDSELGSVPSKCFSGCSKLKALILRGTGVSGLDDANALEGTLIENGTGYIYVMSKDLTDYQENSKWSAYANQFRALEDYTVDGTPEGELDETKI